MTQKTYHRTSLFDQEEVDVDVLGFVDTSGSTRIAYQRNQLIHTMPIDIFLTMYKEKAND